MPDGAIYKACGNRRASVCPACARTYQYDAYQLLRAGLSGGKGVPETVATHPAVFVTLTAPSFGARAQPGGQEAHLPRQTPLRLPTRPLPRPHRRDHPRPLRPRPAGGLLRPARRRRSPARAAVLPGLLRPRRPGRLQRLGRETVAPHQTSHRPPHPTNRQTTRHPPAVIVRTGKRPRRVAPVQVSARQGRRNAATRASCTSTPSSASTASTPTTRPPSSPHPTGSASTS